MLCKGSCRACGACSGNTFCYEAETAGGKMEQKEHILDERDELWARITAHLYLLCLPPLCPAGTTSGTLGERS